MKKNFGVVLAIALGLSALLLTIAFQAGWVKAKPFAQEERSGAPSIVNYQGAIWEGADPYNGIGHFKFSIMDSTGTIQYWSNDGADPPTTSVPLPVSNGLFSVNLGDPLLTGMTQPISVMAFDVPNTRLRVWFSPDDISFTQMPDQVIAAVPYALQAQLAADADTLDGVQGSGYQLQVTGSCLSGQAVRAVNSDGSVVCETIPEVATFSLSSIDFTGIVGGYSSMAIGTDGLGLISYLDYSMNDLKVAHCSNTACSSATSYALDSTMGFVGGYTSIAIGTAGYGLISYFEQSNADLKVARCYDIACSIAESYTLDSTEDVGSYTDIAIGTDGLGLISYFDITNSNLKVAHCSDFACSSASTYTLDSTGSVGVYTAIAIGTDGLGLISYLDVTNYNLKVAHCSDIACSSASTYTLDSTGMVGAYTSIAIGMDGLGLISYSDDTNHDLKVAHCSDIACSSASTYTLDSTGMVGAYTTIAIGMDGLGLISYLDDSNGNLKVAHCSNTACSSAYTYALDSTDNVGAYTSIAIGMDGLGLISYYNYTSYDLKVAHCSNRFCNPDH